MNVDKNKSLSDDAGMPASSRAARGIYGSTIASQGSPTYYVAGSFAALVTAKIDL